MNILRINVLCILEFYKKRNFIDRNIIFPLRISKFNIISTFCIKTNVINVIKMAEEKILTPLRDGTLTRP